MKEIASVKIRNAPNPAPRQLMAAVVCILCLGLLGSALYTFATLSRLRVQYLTNRGHEIAAALEAQARGPGKRSNPAFWQALFDENYEAYSGTVAFLALVDQSGNLLAGKGASLPGPLESEGVEDDEVYRFEEVLGRSRSRQGMAHPSVTGWRIRIGLYSASADFIGRTAFVQLALSGLAIMALLGLLVFLLRVLSRFVEMKAREGAEAQLKSLGVMAASLAHEIRNPLGAIKGLTQLAQEELPPGSAAQSQLRTVVAEAERLENLVTNLLDFARPKEPELGEFDLKDLLANVQDMLRPRQEASGVTIRVETSPGVLRVRTDPSGLRQVLLNVLLNAIDAAPPGSQVLLRAIRDESKSSIVLHIDDFGPGLGGRDPDEFFQPFVTTKVQGAGLGLAISRRIIDKLGGAISLADNPQGGARCTIRLPIA